MHLSPERVERAIEWLPSSANGSFTGGPFGARSSLVSTSTLLSSMPSVPICFNRTAARRSTAATLLWRSGSKWLRSTTPLVDGSKNTRSNLAASHPVAVTRYHVRYSRISQNSCCCVSAVFRNCSHSSTGGHSSSSSPWPSPSSSASPSATDVISALGASPGIRLIISTSKLRVGSRHACSHPCTDLHRLASHCDALLLPSVRLLALESSLLNRELREAHVHRLCPFVHLPRLQPREVLGDRLIGCCRDHSGTQERYDHPLTLRPAVGDWRRLVVALDANRALTRLTDRTNTPRGGRDLEHPATSQAERRSHGIAAVHNEDKHALEVWPVEVQQSLLGLGGAGVEYAHFLRRPKTKVLQEGNYPLLLRERRRVDHHTLLPAVVVLGELMRLNTLLAPQLVRLGRFHCIHQPIDPCVGHWLYVELLVLVVRRRILQRAGCIFERVARVVEGEVHLPPQGTNICLDEPNPAAWADPMAKVDEPPVEVGVCVEEVDRRVRAELLQRVQCPVWITEKRLLPDFRRPQDGDKRHRFLHCDDHPGTLQAPKRILVHCLQALQADDHATLPVHPFLRTRCSPVVVEVADKA
eukprot:7391485-Prymnesium_polylepis.6